MAGWKACIFDLDGTLLNTLESMWVSVNKTLDEMGLFPITEEQCRKFVGQGADHLIRESLKAAGDPDAERFGEAREIYQRVFRTGCVYHNKYYPGVKEILGNLKKRGVKLAVLSNKQNEMTKRVIETAYGRELFDVILGQKDSRPRKPDPAGVYEALKLLGADKEDCLYIGDSEIDARTGRNAGLCTAIVTWGFRSREVVAAENPNVLIDTADELERCILTGQTKSGPVY